MKLGRWLPWVALLLLAAFPLVAPVLGLDFYVGFVRRVLIFALAAAGLNFILGYGGLAALGHCGFLGVGAYVLVALADAGVHSAWLLWPAALLVAALVAALVGLVALRTRGVYFIMITLAFAQMLYYVAVSLRPYGGDDGYNLATPTSFGFGLNTLSDGAFYWTVLALFAGAMALFNRATRSRFGHALMGVRDNETRMRALGFPVGRIQLAAFAIAGGVAGLAGAMLVSHNNFASPSMMHWTQSATLLVMVVIGGVGQRWGGPVGAAVWIGLEEIVKAYTDYWHLPLGVLLVAIVFLAPRGLAGLLQGHVRKTRAASAGPATGSTGEGAA